MTRFPAEFIPPVNGSCVYSNGSVLPNVFYMRQGISTFQLYTCMPLEVNRCKLIPLDLFMVLFIGLVFRNDVTSMQSIIACQKHISLLTARP